MSDSASSNTGQGGMLFEEYREIKCCFSVTIRRDAYVNVLLRALTDARYSWGVPVAIMGQWIVSVAITSCCRN